MRAPFRRFVPTSEHPKLAGLCELDARGYRRRVMQVEWLRDWIAAWQQAYEQPFRGITTDGMLRSGLFPLQVEDAPVADMARAAKSLLQQASYDQRLRMCFEIDAPDWRRWSNPEFYVNEVGIRLEEEKDLFEPIALILRASLSARGYRKVFDTMKMNAFLGELCNARGVMNALSYNFSLFGTPGIDSPWGWQVFGHHLVLNCFVLEGQMVLSPCFLGAEPNEIDTGPDAGLRLFVDEQEQGLGLMRSLDEKRRGQAWVFRQMRDPAMPPGRFHRADQRQLGGAFQDNRIIPNEGINAAQLTAPQRKQLLEIARTFLEILPAGPLEAKMTAIEHHLAQTWFCWIGGYGDQDPFYYRIQNPVVMLEFDHHSGVFLSNTDADKCHIHTIIRTPNGNDYGKDLLRQHYRRAHPGFSPGGF